MDKTKEQWLKVHRGDLENLVFLFSAENNFAKSSPTKNLKICTVVQ